MFVLCSGPHGSASDPQKRRWPSRSVSSAIRLSRTRAQLNCRRKKPWRNKDRCLMGMALDHQLHQPRKNVVHDNGPLRNSRRIGRSLYLLTALIRDRSALFVAIALTCSAGCASSTRVAVVNSNRQEPTPHFETSPVNEALDNHTGQMAEEDQRRAAQAYERMPLRNKRFRDEPIRPSPRP